MADKEPEEKHVRLRIAGIFYDEYFEYDKLKPIPAFHIPKRHVPSTTTPTIFELLEAAFNNPGKDKKGFIYVFERRFEKHDDKEGSLSITSLGVTHEKDIYPSLGLKRRPKGTYQLTEAPLSTGVVAWQYYVYRNGISYSQRDVPTSGPPVTGYSPVPGTRGFVGFDQFQLEPGDEVIYRMVAILRGPNVPDGY